MKSYSMLTSYKSVMQNIQNAIENVLKESNIKNSRISYINQVFSTLQENTKFADIPLGHSFIKYSGGDGSGLGIVLTPQHLTEFMCDLAGVNKNSRLMKKHTLKAVFSMPDDIFYPTGTNVCVMVWEAHTPHDSAQETFFGYCKEDGFAKRKKLGRIDVFDKWERIEAEWLRLYRNRDVVDGMSARRCVGFEDEWLCEAYMQTDYSKLTQDDFQSTLNDYLAYLIKEGDVYEP